MLLRSKLFYCLWLPIQYNARGGDLNAMPDHWTIANMRVKVVLILTSSTITLFSKLQNFRKYFWNLHFFLKIFTNIIKFRKYIRKKCKFRKYFQKICNFEKNVNGRWSHCKPQFIRYVPKEFRQKSSALFLPGQRPLQGVGKGGAPPNMDLLDPFW